MFRRMNVCLYDSALTAVGDQIIQIDQGTTAHRTADNNSR